MRQTTVQLRVRSRRVRARTCASRAAVPRAGCAAALEEDGDEGAAARAPPLNAPAGGPAASVAASRASALAAASACAAAAARSTLRSAAVPAAATLASAASAARAASARAASCAAAASARAASDAATAADMAAPVALPALALTCTRGAAWRQRHFVPTATAPAAARYAARHGRAPAATAARGCRPERPWRARGALREPGALGNGCAESAAAAAAGLKTRRSSSCAPAVRQHARARLGAESGACNVSASGYRRIRGAPLTREGPA